MNLYHWMGYWHLSGLSASPSLLFEQLWVCFASQTEIFQGRFCSGYRPRGGERTAVTSRDSNWDHPDCQSPSRVCMPCPLCSLEQVACRALPEGITSEPLQSTLYLENPTRICKNQNQQTINQNQFDGMQLLLKWKEGGILLSCSWAILQSFQMPHWGSHPAERD